VEGNSVLGKGVPERTGITH